MGKILTLNFEFEIPNIVFFLNLESGTVFPVFGKTSKMLGKII